MVNTVIDLAGLQRIGHLNVCHVTQEIDVSDLDIQHLEAGTLFEVGDEGGTVLRLDVLDLLVEDDLRRDTFVAVPPFKAPCQCKHQYVSNKQQIPCQTISLETQRVNNRHGDDEEHIVHLADRHRFRTITDHTEDSKQTEHETRLDIQNLHQPQQQEHTAREQHKLHIVVAPTAVTIVDAIDERP